MADLVTFTDDTTIGAVSTNPLGEFPLQNGHSYVLKYHISIIDSGGAPAYYEFIMGALRDSGGAITIAFLEETFRNEVVFSPEVVEIVEGQSSSRIYVVGTGITALTIRWRCEVYLEQDRLI